MHLHKTKLITAMAFAMVTFNSSANSVAENEIMSFDKVISAESFNYEIEKSAKLHKKLLNAGISPAITAQAMSKYISFAMLQNGDSENREIDCSTYPLRNYASNFGCSAFIPDYSHTEADVLFFYHPKWANKQKSIGQAYKAIKSEIDKANAIFAKNTPVKLRLVGFEQPTFSGYRDFEKARWGQELFDELVALGAIDVPNSIDFSTALSNDSTKTDGTTIIGLDTMLGYSSSYVNSAFKGDVDPAILPNDASLMYRYGSDIDSWGRLQETETSPNESSVCGFAGNNRAVLLLSANTLTSSHCPLVLTHEIGHVYLANHDIAHKGDIGSEHVLTRAAAAPCGNSHTVMYYASVKGLKEIFSSPDAFIDGDVCGDERTMNNAKMVTITAPFVANISNTMEVYGDVWFSSEAINTSESAKQFTITVQRNGDLTKPTSVKMFIDNGYLLLDKDFIDVQFANGVDTQTVTFNIIDNTSTTANPTLLAELVTPLQLSVSKDKASISIDIVNDDVEITPPVTPPVTPPADSNSSGGGSLGLLSLFGMLLLRRLRA